MTEPVAETDVEGLAEALAALRASAAREKALEEELGKLAEEKHALSLRLHHQDGVMNRINAAEVREAADKALKEALRAAVVVTAYNAKDPLAIRLEFASGAGRLAAAEAMDAALSKAEEGGQ